MERAQGSAPPTEADAPAGERYLLLADISGYTGFMAGVEQEHGVDFSAGIPVAYSVLGALLDAVIEGLAPDFALVKLEGDAVFAVAPAASLDGQGDRVLVVVIGALDNEPLVHDVIAKIVNARNEILARHVAREIYVSRQSSQFGECSFFQFF